MAKNKIWNYFLEEIHFWSGMKVNRKMVTCNGKFRWFERDEKDELLCYAHLDECTQGWIVFPSDIADGCGIVSGEH